MFLVRIGDTTITEHSLEDAKRTAERTGGRIFISLGEHERRLASCRKKLKTAQRQVMDNNARAARDFKHQQDYLPYEEDDRR